MNAIVLNCTHCGGPLHLAPGQCLCRCPYCGHPYFLDHGLPPAVVLADELTAAEARNAVLSALRDTRIESGFRKKTFFERATLYYIPFNEVRGIKAGWIAADPQNSGRDAFSVQSFEYIEPANDLSTLYLDVLDRNVVETAMLKARQVPFQPAEMRSRGIVLPAQTKPPSRPAAGIPDLRDTIETHLRLIYLPVWEIAYSFRGMVFHSYCSAVDGAVILVNGLRNHRRKLALSLLGCFSLALLLGRTMRFALRLLFGIRFGPIPVLSAAVLLAGVTLLWAILFPYLWRLYAFREEIRISGAYTATRTINYRENGLLRFSRRLVSRLSRENESGFEP